MEIKVLLTFCLILLGCIVLKLPVLLALGCGLMLFVGYGLWRGFSLAQLFKMCWESIVTIHNILLTFVLIGMLTASWRASGTIPVIITLASKLIDPHCFAMTAFILNAMISFLIGTSFGTVATIGVICMSIAQTLQIDSFWVAGAIVSGIYFGDRCSPVSTSALLVATLTETDLYENIKRMLKTCAVPTLICCGIYYWMGRQTGVSSEAIVVRGIFASSFDLSLWCLLPAVVVIGLALLRVNVKSTMGASIITAIGVAAVIQGLDLLNIGKFLLLGYTAPTAALGKLLNGGGVISMVTVFCVVCIACCYSGIFTGTGLLTNIIANIEKDSQSLGRYPTVLLTAIIGGMIACNQSLNIMLTHQLVQGMYSSPEELAVDMEDSAVIMSPCVPWNIAVAVPLTIIGASSLCILAACFLYVLPLWRLLVPYRLLK